MTKLRRVAATMFFLLFSALWTYSATAQTTKLNVGYSAISGDQLPAWVAKEAGIFQKNGLDVQLVYFTGGTTAVMALISADTPLSQVAGSAVVNSVLSGSDAVNRGGRHHFSQLLLDGAAGHQNSGAAQRRLCGD